MSETAPAPAAATRTERHSLRAVVLAGRSKAGKSTLAWRVPSASVTSPRR